MNAIKHRWWGLLAMTAAVTGVFSAGAAAQGENLLTNPGFEAPYAFIQGDAVRQVAQGWSAWYVPAPAGSPVSQLVQPEYYAASDVANVLGVPRIRSGADAQHLAAFYATFEGGVLQSVSGVVAGQTYTFSAYSYAWSSSLENVDLSEQGSAVFVQVGIDPLAGTDPAADSVIWSEAGPATLDTYTQHSVTATAQADTLTTFIRVLTAMPVKNTAVFLDDAQLAEADAAAIAEATTEAEATDTAVVGAEPTEDIVGAEPTEDVVAAEPTEETVVAEPTEDVIAAEPTEEATEVVVAPEASPESEATAQPEATEAVVVPAVTEVLTVPTPEIAPEVTEVATEAVVAEVTEVATEEVSAQSTGAATNGAETTPAVATETSLPEVTSEITAEPSTPEATAEAVAAQPTQDIIPTQEFFEPSATPTETTPPTETPVPTASYTPSPVPTLDLTAYPGRFFYTVQAGDNVARIAEVFGTSIEAILAANGLTVESIIYVNQQLTIPVNLPFVQPTDVLLVTPTPTVDPAAPTPLPPTAVPPTTATYRVGYGENLTYIAFRFGTTVRALARLNNISNPNLIYPGQVLIVPVNQNSVVPTPVVITELQGQAAQEPTTYRVQRGDNLYNIALRFNISLASLIQSNGLVDANRIYVGQVLIIP